MKQKIRVSSIVDTSVTFQAVPATGDNVVLFARMTREQFEQICAANSDLEDFEDDETEVDDDIEADETEDGYSA